MTMDDDSDATQDDDDAMQHDDNADDNCERHRHQERTHGNRNGSNGRELQVVLMATYLPYGNPDSQTTMYYYTVAQFW